MLTSLGVIYTVFLRSGCALGLTLLSAASLLLLSSVGPQPGLLAQVMVVVFTVSMPLTGFIAALVLEHYLFQGLERRQGSLFRQLGTLLGVLVLFEGFGVRGIVEAVSWIGQRQHISSTEMSALCAAIVLSLCNAVIVCTSIIAVILMLVSLLAELPIRLIRHTAGFRFQLPFASMRMWMVLIVFALASQLIAGLLVTELSPLALIQKATQK